MTSFALIFIISIKFHNTISKNVAILYLGNATFKYANDTKNIFNEASANKKTYNKLLKQLKYLTAIEINKLRRTKSSNINDKQLSQIMANYFNTTYKFANRFKGRNNGLDISGFAVKTHNVGRIKAQQ